MARIPDDVLDSVRRAADVAEVVGRYVALKRTGRNWGGLCPFHQEKTPSFHVWQETGTWRCFGCGKGGNVFQFLMEREGLRFHEAVRQLARENGIPLPDDDDPEAAARAARLEGVRRVVEWACTKFEAGLRSPEGARAREYLKGRGIAGATAKAFRLGYALPGWERLLDAARSEGISDAELLEAGLVIPREGREGCYDRFRDRVVFPIQDPQGRVIAFGARTLGDDEPKYLNSPETPLFTKGRHLYAFHLAKGEMLRSGEGAVMEGYTDVILAHQSGFKVAVAGLGTALTPDQARRIAPYVKKLYLVYDADAAGLRAAERAIPAFLPEPIETRVCVLTGERDPAEVFVEDGADGFRRCLEASREAFDHLIEARRAAHDVEGVPGRTAAVDECLTALAGVKDEIRRALYVKRLADAYDVPESAATTRLAQIRERAAARRPDPPRGRAPSPRPAATSPASGAPADGSAAPPAPDPNEPWVAPRGGEPDDEAGHDVPAGTAGEAETEAPAGPAPAVERQLVEALLGAPELCADLPDWLPGELTHRDCRRLVERLLAARPDGGGAPDVDRVVGTLDRPELGALAAELRASGEGKRLPEQGRDCVARLASLHEGRRLREGLRQPDSDAEEADLLRRLQDHHRRRAGPER